MNYASNRRNINLNKNIYFYQIRVYVTKNVLHSAIFIQFLNPEQIFWWNKCLVIWTNSFSERKFLASYHSLNQLYSLSIQKSFCVWFSNEKGSRIGMESTSITVWRNHPNKFHYIKNTNQMLSLASRNGFEKLNS